MCSNISLAADTVLKESISIKVENEWSRLQCVVMGDASTLRAPVPWAAYPPGTLSPSVRAAELLAWWIFGRKLLPHWFRTRFAREIAALESILRSMDVRILKPTPIEPLPEEPPGLSQIFPRDSIIAVGNALVKTKHRIETLRKEARGLQWIVEAARAGGSRVIDGIERLEGTFLEGGDVLIDLPHVFVGVGSIATNQAGAEWLQRVLGPDYRVIPVPICDPCVFHLDTVLTIIGPRLGIVFRPALAALPPPLDSYDLIEVDRRTFREIGVNVLIPSPGTVILQKRHCTGSLGHELTKRGLRVIGVPFTTHAIGLGSVRCATHPLVRAE